MQSAEKTKSRPINRLQSMYALRAEVDKMYADAEQASTAGKPVAWAMLGQWVEPILSAMDVLTIYPENYGSVCAAAGKAPPFLEISDAEGYPSHLCGYARNCFGYSVKMRESGGRVPADAPMGGMPRPNFLVASSEICDARFKWFQALGRYFSAPVWTIESPYPSLKEGLEEGAEERNIGFLVRQLREFVAFLEQVLGRKMDWDRLDEIARGTAALNRLRWEINRLRCAHPGPMHSRDFWSSMSAALFHGSDAQAVLKGFENLRAEVQQRVDHGISALNGPEKFRLSFDGLPPWHSLNIFDRLAERGWNFVIESNYRPSTPVEIDRDLYADPLERFVRGKYSTTCNLLKMEYPAEEAELIKAEILRTGNWRSMNIKHVQDCQCDGAVIHVLLSCRSASFNLLAFQQKLMDVLKVPALVIEGDMVDASLFNPAEIMRRAEAFEDTMRHFRKVRKELGMSW